MIEEMILVPQGELDRLHALEKENAYLKNRMKLVESMSEVWRKSCSRQQDINVATQEEVASLLRDLKKRIGD